MPFFPPPATLSSCKIARYLIALSCLVATALPTLAAYNPLAEAMGFNVFVENNMALGGGHVGAGTAVGGSVLMNGSGIFGMDRAGDYTALAVKGGIVWSGSLTFGSRSYSVPTNSTYNASVSHGTVGLGDTTGSYHWYQSQYSPSWTDTTPRTTAKLNSSETGFNSGSQLTLSPTPQSAASIHTDPGIDFAAKFLSFRQTATTLASLANASTSAGTLTGSTLALNLKSNQVNFVTLTSAEFQSLGNLTFSGAELSAQTGLVFNITGSGAVTFGSFNPPSTTSAPYILYNFANATSVAMTDRTIAGSILAPNAVFTHSDQNVDGQIIAQSFLQLGSGETHDVMLNLQVVPEPAAVAAFLGLFVLGFVAWRRRGGRT